MKPGLDPLAIIGGGIGGLTLALFLHRRGVPCQVYESAQTILPLGVGLNLLPHAMALLHELGLEESILRRGIETQEYCYVTRHGQLVDREPRGRFAGHERPQVSIHRAELHTVLLDAARERLGRDAVKLGHRCIGMDQGQDEVTVHFDDGYGTARPSVRSPAAIACDGIHSVARKIYHGQGAQLRYEGTMQYRGTTIWTPYLTGATMLYVGTVEFGKLVMYPIRDNVDGTGRQLINWVVEVERPMEMLLREWNRTSQVEEFIGHFADARFPWLDVCAVLENAQAIYEYPMVDQDPLPSWTTGRVTLLGDAAHPMMPRGSNGSAQAMLDAGTLSELLASEDEPAAALQAYEAARLDVTAKVVLANRRMSPDAILHEIEERSGGRPFENVDDVMPADERRAWQRRYRQIAGFETQADRSEWIER